LFSYCLCESSNCLLELPRSKAWFVIKPKLFQKFGISYCKLSLSSKRVFIVKFSFEMPMQKIISKTYKHGKGTELSYSCNMSSFRFFNPISLLVSFMKNQSLYKEFCFLPVSPFVAFWLWTANLIPIIYSFYGITFFLM